ncbi:MAG: protein TolR [Alphaproteobacteria bacterium]|jgi:biopolymer transport protein TolR|nr:protein TolR [Alphaproteobacteria bacterium]MBT4084491.1 protein TolR [Alphaproteobacteria bacterium]MBT4545702.1 protein TolR [Alphaproteobacteria bacterium]MBT7744305.1 protein TolR [Alphaproteobacteria bacterium]
MAGSLPGSGNRGRSSRWAKAPMAEINVTPFVDVMLVLLVIFMITAPLLTVGVPIDLPKTQAKPLQGQDEPLAVTIDKDGEIWLQETKVDAATLVPRLNAIIGNKPDTRIFVRGDKTVSYGQVLEVMGILNTAGFSRVGLVTERPSTPK